MKVETQAISMRNNKSHGKDIMLLCKGWHDKDKYKTTKDALIAYYNKNYRYPEEYVETLSFRFINEVLLKPALQELLNDRFRFQLIDFLFKPYVFGTMNRKGLTYDEELYFRMTEFLSGLRAVEDDDTVLINTDVYWLQDSGMFIKEDNHKILIEQIIQ